MTVTQRSAIERTGPLTAGRPPRLSLAAMAKVFLILLAAVSAPPGASADPAGTAFTYQGHMRQGVFPAAGPHDFIFRAFAVELGGSALGTSAANNIPVEDGVFTATVDFGAGVITGEALWLEIAVRATGDANPHTTLAPRQRITPAPMAIVAGMSLDSLSLGGLPAADFTTDAELAAAVAGLAANPPVPAAPSSLRLLPSLRGAPHYNLAWTVDNPAGVINFIVYESPSPITDGNKAAAQKRFSAATQLEIAVFGNSGLRHFRVTALNFAGVESPLSSEFALDTTLRAAFLSDVLFDDVEEIYATPLAAGAINPVKLNGPLLTTSDVNFQTAVSPDGRRLAFLGDLETDGVFELYVAPIDGSGPAVKVNPPLIPGGRVNNNPYFFAPDGTRLVFTAQLNTAGVTEIYSAPSAGGGSVARLNLPLPAGRSLGFSPMEISSDGKWVAYTTDLDALGIFDLYVSPVAGVETAVKINPPLVAGGNFDFAAFRFSPDGTRLVYHVDQEVDGKDELYLVPAAGGALPVKINPGMPNDRNVEHFVISPDSARIAYVADLEANDVFELFVAPLAAGALPVKINAPLPVGGDVSAFSFQFSPDGSQIAYVAEQEADGRLELFVAPAAGGSAPVKVNSPLVPGGNVSGSGSTNLVIGHRFFFSPDGTRIAYVADQATDAVNELFVSPAAGGGFSEKVNDPLVLGGNVGAIRFSPDGSRIVYTADQDLDTVSEIFVAPASGVGDVLKLHADLPATRDATSLRLTTFGWLATP